MNRDGSNAAIIPNRLWNMTLNSVNLYRQFDGWASNAVRMSLRGDGTHFVSLDKVIKTMRETGADMKSKYKETAGGGLAVNAVECWLGLTVI